MTAAKSKDVEVQVDAAIKFAEGLFWAARMSAFTGWGKRSVEMPGGPTGHDVLTFSAENGIGGRA